jgi:diguanylate cyclase (GGDEF)-like protein
MPVKNNTTYTALYFLRSLFVFFVPGGLLVLAAFLADHYGLVTPWLSKIENIVPYSILAIGVILGWRFHRSRLAFVILILFLSERSLYYYGTSGSFAFGHENSILLTNSILLPLNIALFFLVKERGIFNLGGIFKVMFVFLQPLVIYLLLRLQPDFFQYLSYQFISIPQLNDLPLTQPVLLINGVFLLLFFIGSVFGGSPVVRGFFWAMVATLVAFVMKSKGQSPILYYCSAEFIIIISVLETAYAMAFHDELTGLPARRALNTALHGLGRHYVIAMLDIDFFKKFNDNYGHDVGDQVLCMVASQLRRVGGGGRPYRYGGEEFTILFSGKSKEDALPHLENLRQSIQTAQFALRGKNRPKKPPKKSKKTKTQLNTVSVTISIGVAEPDKSHPRPVSVMKAADQALYKAKKGGRNCIAT